MGFIKPFTLLEMLWTFVSAGMMGRIVLYLLLIAAGVGARCLFARRREFWLAAGISTGLWVVCEIIGDIGAAHEGSISLFSAAYTLGALSFCFAVGLWLCALICRLVHRKQLA